MYGPQLPADLKRKREEEEEDGEQRKPTGPTMGPSMGTSIGPQRPEPVNEGSRQDSPVRSPKVTGPQIPVGPQLPPQTERKVMGPTMPPAPLDEMPPHPPESESESDGGYGPSIPSAKTAPSGNPDELDLSDSSDDEGFGPAPPKEDTSAAEEAAALRRLHQRANATATATSTQSKTSSGKPERDEWMLAPPSGLDLSARMDPTHLKNRKFQSGKGARAPVHNTGGIGNTWTETPEQKRKRLENELLGVSKPAYMGENGEDMRDEKKRREDEETARRLRKEIEQTRGESLTKMHRAKKEKEGKDADDDPTKRAFDWEKDIKGGTVSLVQRQEMMKQTRNFGSRFDSGRFL